MDLQIIKVVGQVAGIGGLAVGALLLIFRDVVRKNIFPNLTKGQAYSLLRLILILVWSIALAGIAAWTYATTINRDSQGSPVPQNSNLSISKELELTGIVKGEDTPLEGADVFDLVSGVKVSSDQEGRFTLKVKETSNGWARIRISKSGFEEWEDYVRIGNSLVIPLRRKL